MILIVVKITIRITSTPSSTPQDFFGGVLGLDLDYVFSRQELVYQKFLHSLLYAFCFFFGGLFCSSYVAREFLFYTDI